MTEFIFYESGSCCKENTGTVYLNYRENLLSFPLGGRFTFAKVPVLFFLCPSIFRDHSLHGIPFHVELPLETPLNAIGKEMSISDEPNKI